MTREEIQEQFRTSVSNDCVPVMLEYRGATLGIAYDTYSDPNSAYITISTYDYNLHDAIKDYLKNYRSSSIAQVKQVIDTAYEATETLNGKIKSLVNSTITSLMDR